MAAGQEVPPLALALVAGQVQRVLVEPGSTLVVAQGGVRVHFPFAWLAEHTLARSLTLAAEEVHELAAGGWIELEATEAAAVVLLPPAASGLWAKIGAVLAALRDDLRPAGGRHGHC